MSLLLLRDAWRGVDYHYGNLIPQYMYMYSVVDADQHSTRYDVHVLVHKLAYSVVGHFGEVLTAFKIVKLKILQYIFKG